MPKISSLVFAGALLAAAPAVAQPLSSQDARKWVDGLYAMFTEPATKDVKAIAETYLAPEWKSYADDKNFKDRSAFAAQVGAIGQMIPDLKWQVREVLADGDRIVVRSIATGTPKGALFGQPTNGKSFEIMAIDIHTLKNGKGVSVHHVEDWASAMRQVVAK